MAKDKGVAADPLDFADFVFYFKKAHAPCDELRAQIAEVAQAGEVISEDVDEIAPDTKPAWLWGVPAIVPLKPLAGAASMQPLYGSEALRYTKAWCAAKPKLSAGTYNSLARVSFAELGQELDATLASDEQGESDISLDEIIRRRGEGIKVPQN